MDIAEWEVGDSCMGQMFVKIIICNNLEGRPETYKPVAPGESGWNQLGTNVCWLFLPFIARYKKEIYASKKGIKVFEAL